MTQKAELMNDMQDAITELKEVLSGRKESRDMYDFLKELESTDE